MRKPKFTEILRDKEMLQSMIGIRLAQFSVLFMPRRLRKSFKGAVMTWAIHVNLWMSQNRDKPDAEVPVAGEDAIQKGLKAVTQGAGFPVVADELDVSCGIICSKSEEGGHGVVFKVGGEHLSHEGALKIARWFKTELERSSPDGFMDATKHGEQNISKSLH